MCISVSVSCSFNLTCFLFLRLFCPILGCFIYIVLFLYYSLNISLLSKGRQRCVDLNGKGVDEDLEGVEIIVKTH